MRAVFARRAICAGRRLLFDENELAADHPVNDVELVHDLHVVRYDDDAEIALLRELLEQVDDLFTVFGVEVSGRLVREKEVRVTCKRTRDRDSLLFAA